MTKETVLGNFGKRRNSGDACIYESLSLSARVSICRHLTEK